MATNYFQQLGLNSFNPLQALSEGQAYKMNQFNLDTAKTQEAERIAMNQQKEQAAQIKFANEQQKAKAAQTAGMFYNALNSGDIEGAKAIVIANSADVNSLGDPSFTSDRIVKMLDTPEGVKQLTGSALGIIQMAGGPEQFAKFTQEQRKPEQASDTPASIRELEYYQKLQQTNPEAAAKFAKSRGYVDTPKEQALTPQERNMEKYQALVAAGNPNAEAFGRSAGILSKEGQVLSATSEKALQDSVAESELNATNTTKYLDLASRFKESDIAGGILGTGGSWREALKSAAGSQDEVSKIVGEWTKIRSGEAIASLPQGPATDADIRLALKPLPENANGDYMDKYLRGLAKIAEYKASYNQAKADFISENGSLRANGANFGADWNKKREAVLKRINQDLKFKRQDVKKFLGREAAPQVQQRDGVQLSINENPASTNVQEEFTIIEVRE
jgi:hypothetical protein